MNLPLLATMGVGSYAPPGWYIEMQRRVRAGELGPDDVEELVDDAIRIVIADQIEAGVDVLTDGELSRQRFVYEVFGRLRGLERIPPTRHLGLPGYDMAPSFTANEQITAEGGLGTVAEFMRLRRLAPGKHLKITVPGPVTFLNAIRGGTRPRPDLLEDLIRLLQEEMSELERAGAEYVQLDEPGLTRLDDDRLLARGVEAINRAAAVIPGRRAVHICFGNNIGRPMADRRFSRIESALGALDCDELVLEFANRGMTELELAGSLSSRYTIAAGVVDVKNWWLEPPDEVARRIELCLQYIPVDRLRVTADCGFSALPRYLARQKLTSLVAGAHIVRGEYAE